MECVMTWMSMDVFQFGSISTPSGRESSGKKILGATDGVYIERGFAFRRKRAWRPRDSMMTAMDDLIALMMLVNEIAPKAMVAKTAEGESSRIGSIGIDLKVTRSYVFFIAGSVNDEHSISD